MLPLRWTEHAVTQLEGVVDYISATSPVYAEGVVLRIDQRLQLARVHPEIGKRVPEKDDPTIRELVAPAAPAQFMECLQHNLTLAGCLRRRLHPM